MASTLFRLVWLLAAMLFSICAAAPEAAANDGQQTPTPVPKNRSAYSPEQFTDQVVYVDIAVAPNGSELAVVSDRSGSRELWTASIRKGGIGKLTQRTRAGQTVSEPAYSPDGSKLAFVMDRGGDERNDLYLLERGATAPVRLTQTVTSEKQAVFSYDGRFLAFLADPDRDFQFELHVMDLKTRAVRRVTHESANLSTPRWSRDGRTLAVTRTRDFEHGSLLFVDVATGQSREVPSPEPKAIIWPIDFFSDGRLLAASTNRRGFLQMALIDPGAPQARFVGPSDADIEFAAVMDDGSLVYSRNVRGDSEVAIASGPDPFKALPQRLASGGVIEALVASRADHGIFAIRETSQYPSQVIRLDVGGHPEQVLIPARLGKVRTDWLARAERREFKSFDGLAIDAYIWKPPVARLGTPPPAVVLVHGGPSFQLRNDFWPLAQSIAEAGFAVIGPNYRGSTGYGKAFEDLNNRDWGGGDLKDIDAVVDALAAAGEIDPDRVAIFGGSFGGYMVLRALVTEPARWRAGIDMYGPSDLEEDFRLTENRLGNFYRTEMGDPATDREFYRERSPIHGIDRIRVPLLVLQGANDTRVVKAASDRVVEKLRALGREVEYVVFDDEGHGFTQRKNRQETASRIVEFLRKHVAAVGTTSDKTP